MAEPDDDETLQFDSEHDPSTEFGFLQPSDTPGLLGKLAHYEIQQVLGRGGFGVVFQAFDTKLQRAVAIKVIAPALASTSPARKRFLREARAAAAIRHSNVVQIYGVHEEPLPYLVMELIKGQTLQQRSDAVGPMSLEELLCIGGQIANGLNAAHKKELLHRDIKPDNILIEAGNDLKIKITDFGLARTVDEASLTRTGSIAGTPMYMSPEQASEQAVDHRADLFSLGSVLYMMATGRPPFRAPTTLAVLRRVAEDTPRPIAEIIPETPAWLCAIIAKLHAKSPADRFQSAEHVAQLLTNCLEQLRENGQVRAADELLLETQLCTKSADLPQSSRSQRSSGPNYYAKAIALCSALLAVVMLVAWLAYPTLRNYLGNLGALQTSQSGSIPAAAADGPLRVGGISHDANGAKGPSVKFEAKSSVTLVQDRPATAIAPFDSASAVGFQEAWSRYLNLHVNFENNIGVQFRLIPPGSFMMGSTQVDVDKALEERAGADWTAGFKSEMPQHLVRLNHPIYISAHEVTQQEYMRVMGENPSTYAFGAKNEDGKVNYDSNQPVETVSWLDAIRFCNELGAYENRELHYQINGNEVSIVREGGYRLPTEAEWEFACRAGTTTRFWTGDADDSLDRASWTARQSKKTPQPVGLADANPFGLHDTIGNVLEWVEDPWQPDYYSLFVDTPAIDPRNRTDTTNYRIAKGGCFDNPPNRCRSAVRRQRLRSNKNGNIGFRIALVIDDERLLPPTATEAPVRHE